MAKAATRASKLTTLVMGKVEVAVALFPTVAAPSKLAQFDTAGPNGGVLKAQTLAVPTPVSVPVDEPDQPVRSDPFADDPGPDVPPSGYQRAPVPIEQDGAEVTFSTPVVEFGGVIESNSVAGQYGRELVEEGTGEVVPPDAVRRGVRLEDGRFIDCTEQLAAIDERTQIENIRIVGFVDITRVPRAQVIGSYFICAGAPEAAKPLRLIFEGLRARRRGAAVKFTKNKRQTRGVIGWYGDALMFYELAWAEDFREPPARALVIQKAAVSESEVETVCRLIDAMPIPIDDLQRMRDDAIALREELRARAEAGEIAEVVEPLPALEPESELADALEASLAAMGA